jgi:metal-sulfur cluster biosynthetic enzyme
MRLLEAAYRRRDYRVARSLADSLRQSLTLEQQQQLPLDSAVVSAANHFVPVASLPEQWREWARGWSFAKIIALDETVNLARENEPVELAVAFRADQTASLTREVRVARVDGGVLREARSQVSEEIRRGEERQCRVTFFATTPAHQRTYWLIFYGNPDAELPRYPTDLSVTGEGVGLDFENEYFRGSLSRQMGQLERLTLKREHGLELFAGGEGHGEPPGIDWAHDYVTSGNFQKLRVTNWPECPDFEVIRGPLSLTVRRWGFPHSTVAPLFSPARMNVFVEYRFYAGTPWFMKVGSMKVLKEIEIGYLRDDEWVFSGMSFTDILWMSADGKFHVGPVTKGEEKNLWGVGFMNRDTRDSFMALFLEHAAPEHTGAPLFYYKWHGHVWSRAMLHGAVLPAGTVLKQKNAYLTMPFPEQGGAEGVERLRHAMMNPLTASPALLPAGFRGTAAGRLARAGEAGDSPIPKRLLWEALGDCRDEQLYAAKPSVVDLGLVYDIRVSGDVVHVVMAMPHRGRPRVGYFSYGSGGNSMPVRDRLLKVPGVRKVVVEQTWEPHWNANLVTDEGRRKLGIPAF